MITYEKINIYVKYNGSNDLFVKMASDEERKILTRDDWIIIYKFEDFYGNIDGIQPTEDQVVIFENDMIKYCLNVPVFIYAKQMIERQCRDRDTPLLQRIINWLLG
jgi:hypothetical protein